MGLGNLATQVGRGRVPHLQQEQEQQQLAKRLSDSKPKRNMAPQGANGWQPHGEMGRKMMKSLKILRTMGMALMAAVSLVCMAHAESCTDTNSRALCVARATGIAGPLADAKSYDTKNVKTSARSDGAFYGAAALGLASNALRPSSGIELAVMAIGAVASASQGDSPVVGNNFVVGWMPASEADSTSSADAKGAKLLHSAMLVSFPGSTITVHEADTQLGAEGKPVRYRVAGGTCEGKVCVLIPPMNSERKLIGGRSVKGNVPEFGSCSGCEAYMFGAGGSLRVWTLLVDGKNLTHTYMPQLSRNLPEWMFAVASPEKRMSNGRLLNEGQRVPVMFSAGETMQFVAPDRAQRPVPLAIAGVMVASHE